MLGEVEKLFGKLCTPAKFYIIMAASTAVATLRTSPLGAIGGLLGGIAWAIVLNYICASGYTDAAWILVFLPFILLAIAIVAMLVFFLTLPKHKARKEEQEESSPGREGMGSYDVLVNVEQELSAPRRDGMDYHRFELEPKSLDPSFLGE